MRNRTCGDINFDNEYLDAMVDMCKQNKLEGKYDVIAASQNLYSGQMCVKHQK